jgi:hypothetical protein
MIGYEYSYCGLLHCSALGLTVGRITSTLHFLLKIVVVVADETLQYTLWAKCKEVLNVKTAGTFDVL